MFGFDWKLAVLVTLATFAAPRTAHACGGFFSRSALEGPRRPSLSYEQTLIVFDAAKKRQHFIREVSFRKAAEPFGFVVPTPARPSVEKVAVSPFDALRRDLPFQRHIGIGAIGTLGGGSGQGFGRGAGGGVQVLEQKRVGSFTAFVLAADDEKALAGWLKKHGLVSTPEADTWLAHYVKMKFFYVAFRYEPKGEKPKSGAAASMESETVRITFDTPVAYYPYFEPAPPKGVTPTEPRMLELWVASSQTVTPIAHQTQGETRRWVRPMQEGDVHEDARSRLALALADDAKLLPSGALRVQTFIDQKRSRQGYGDVLFAPRSAPHPSAEAMRALVPVLDPTLTGSEK